MMRFAICAIGSLQEALARGLGKRRQILIKIRDIHAYGLFDCFSDHPGNLIQHNIQTL
jgi:hypothetical protein